MNPVISVIIPVYNTEKYLNKCIESVVNQTYQNLEIILVDDEAQDNSPMICDTWKEKDKRIKVIHKKNEGLGLTRNAGLEVATGDFVTFVDSDDSMDTDAYFECMQYIEKMGLDVCCFAKRMMDKNGGYQYAKEIPDKLEFIGEEVKKEFSKHFLGPLPRERERPFLMPTVCCIIYYRQLIEEHKIRFMSERKCLSEDIFFNLEVSRYAQHVYIIPKYFYNYTYNSTSLTKSYKPNKVEKAKEFYKLLLPYKEIFKCVPSAGERLNARFVLYVQMYLRMEVKAICLNGIRKTYNTVKQICDDPFIYEAMCRFPIDKVDFRRKIFVWLMRKKKTTLLICYYILK